MGQENASQFVKKTVTTIAGKIVRKGAITIVARIEAKNMTRWKRQKRTVKKSAQQWTKSRKGRESHDNDLRTHRLQKKNGHALAAASGRTTRGDSTLAVVVSSLLVLYTSLLTRL